MEFSISDEQVRRTTYVVRPRGEIDLAVAGELKDHLLHLIDAGGKSLIVDLGGVSFLDSTGLRALMTAHRRAEDVGGRVVVARAGGYVAEIFEMTGLDVVFPLHSSVDAALAGRVT
jgi:anti-sigma B factor antagonist